MFSVSLPLSGQQLKMILKFQITHIATTSTYRHDIHSYIHIGVNDALRLGLCLGLHLNSSATCLNDHLGGLCLETLNPCESFPPSIRVKHLVPSASRATFHICGNCERSLCAICRESCVGYFFQRFFLFPYFFHIFFLSLLITGKYKWPSLWLGHFNFMQLDHHIYKILPSPVSHV